MSASVRFRSLREESGAGELFMLDPQAIPLGVGGAVPRPQVEFAARDVNRVDQVQPGLSGMLSLEGLGALNFGIQKANYSKKVRFGSGLETSIVSRPLLWNVGIALMLSSTLTLYGGM